MDAWDPGVEAEGGEDAEDEKYNASGVVVAGEHVDGCHEAEDNVEDAAYPDELLRESACDPEVGITEHDRSH